ncbi:MAG: phenylalanine--tRNA ligase subunit beta, partial [Candidatus Zixiibacteriota bacterium]
MKIAYSWLKELTGLDWPVEEMAERLTLCGLSCEDIAYLGRFLDKVVVGEVLTVEPVEGASKIRKTVVSVGKEQLDIVCGAPNVAVGQKVPVALIGAKLDGGMEIRKARIRGVESSGMICSEAELGISADHSGIMVLSPDTPVGAAVRDVLELDDYVLDLELTPNRGDAWSAIGIARDLAAVAGVKLKRPTFKLTESDKPVDKSVSVTIDDTTACPRFTARIIRNLKIGESPWWVKKRLLASGIRPISNIVDVTNLVMLETGNPIHAFDFDRFESNRVLVRRANDGEKLVTLDGREHTLTPDVLLITNGEKPKAAAGVMGGEDSEVGDDTVNVLLEVAYFDPTVIRKSRRALGLNSEASQRFERGVDPNNVPNASARAAYLFAELCGGEVDRGMVDAYPKPIEPKTVTLRPERCDAILGLHLEPRRMTEILTGLEFEVTPGDPITVSVPTFRHDISREIDLIEEVGRIHGYHEIPDAVENIGPLYAPTHWQDRFLTELRQLMNAAGFDEMVGHGLADSKLARLLHPEEPMVRIVNPVSEDLDIVRNSLVVSALPVIAHNIAHREVNLRLFEIGKACFPPTGDRDWFEDRRLLIAVTGETESDWRTPSRALDFYDVKAALEQISRRFHWPPMRFDDEAVPYFEPDVSFAVSCVGQRIGAI